jgi:uncharacterized protein YdiU (UPF0061 family)
LNFSLSITDALLQELPADILVFMLTDPTLEDVLPNLN